MLHRSGDNLFRGALDFIHKSEEVSLFCAYIRTEQLRELNKEFKINRIVVRWEIRDLHQGASDLELYDYCKTNSIALYRNTRIHLKCLVNEKDEVLLGSANITGRGIGEVPSMYNFELNSINTNVDFADILYLDKIISQSEYVSEKLFSDIKQRLESLEDFKNQEDSYRLIEVKTNKKKSDYFLMSELPMYRDVASLYDAAHNLQNLDGLSRKCIAHDLATYNVNYEISATEFYASLGKTFNGHPFIQALKEAVKNNKRQSLGYGRVVEWIKNNTTTVPTPISWELKQDQVVNILYEWLCFFDSDFVVERPGHSEVLFYKP